MRAAHRGSKATGKRVTASAGAIPQRVLIDEIPEKTSTLHIIPPTFADEKKGGKQWKARDIRKRGRGELGVKSRENDTRALFSLVRQRQVRRGGQFIVERYNDMNIT